MLVKACWAEVKRRRASPSVSAAMTLTPTMACTNVPLWILGSSLFGAQLAAMLGLPYAFASHFAPAAGPR
jgi:alkanesulfonate monooxygenase SsuD/methylene tetrahydromethanopterin reductase-like flavin-dependent oxidoreductase (luciferase family)